MRISDLTCGFSLFCVVKVGIEECTLGPPDKVKTEQQKRRLLTCWEPWHLNIHRDHWLSYSCSLTDTRAGVQAGHGWVRAAVCTCKALCCALTSQVGFMAPHSRYPIFLQKQSLLLLPKDANMLLYRVTHLTYLRYSSRKRWVAPNLLQSPS